MTETLWGRALASHIKHLAWVMLLFVSTLAWAEERVGQVVLATGNVAVLRSGASTPLHFGDDIHLRDTLKTGSGELKVLFVDNTLLTLADNTTVLISEHVYAPKKGLRQSLFEISQGMVRAVVDQVKKDGNIRLQTPTAVAGVRGTDLGVRVMQASTRIVCFDGLVEAATRKDPSKFVMVKTGEWTEVSATMATPPAPVTPDTLRQFSDVSEGNTTKEVLQQMGEAPQKEATPTQTDEPSAAPTQGAPTENNPEPSPSPPIIPGGGTETPSDAGGAPVTVPLTFPS